MRRPNTILGLLFHLLTLYARRIPVRLFVLAAFVIAVVAWSRRGGPSPDRDATAQGGLQAAVLRDGFVITHVTAGGRRVVEVDAQGAKRRELPFSVVDGDVRIVGASNGTLAAWLEDKKVRLMRIDNRNDTSTWGKSARRLCDGVASNDHRFGVGWLEPDNAVWVVSGSTSAKGIAQDADLDLASTQAQIDWCGVTSAEKNIALLWRYQNSFRFTTCTEKKCNGMPTSIKFDTKRVVLGFGCLRNACLIASRDQNGSELAYVVESGKTKWKKSLADNDLPISIVGVGGDGFAVGCVGGLVGASVFVYDRDGRANEVWRDAPSRSTPQLAWSKGRLLVAHLRGDAVTTEVIPLPAR